MVTDWLFDSYIVFLLFSGLCVLTLFVVWLVRKSWANEDELTAVTKLFFEQSERLDNFERTINKQAVRIYELEATNAAMAAEIAYLQNDLRERNEQIALLKQSRDAALEKLDHDGKLKDNVIQSLRNDYAKLRTELDTLTERYNRGRKGF
jgi:septal ring factor EnvC (AmiA/AmiB activator)